eukprot:4580484-Alexandrium_andersonii.AAC.1
MLLEFPLGDRPLRRLVLAHWEAPELEPPAVSCQLQHGHAELVTDGAPRSREQRTADMPEIEIGAETRGGLL